MIPLPAPESYAPESDYDAWFWTNAPHAGCRRVLEAGTLQALPGRSTHSMAAFPRVRREDYVRLDVQAGADVDVVGDLHALPQDWNDRFDAFIAIAVWEHLERPWIAAHEVARVLASGGSFLVITHQTFPIHGYPSDFFRFSRDALRLIFEDAGLIVEACDYKNRCIIAPGPAVLPPEGVEGWNKTFPSYIHVGVAGRKPSGTAPHARPRAASAPAPVRVEKPATAPVQAEKQTWMPGSSTASQHAAALAPTMADTYEFAPPSYQNAIDLLPGWNHAFPPELKLNAGPGYMYEDPRIHWAVQQFGSLEGKRVLELGPLEGAHTSLLERLGARRIDAIEANKLAYLRCLVAKEVYGLRRARFHLGDFLRGLQSPTRYDLIVASGVLYHMADPLLLLERMAARTDALYLWTHYFDDEEMPKGDPRRGAFRSPDPPHEEATHTVRFKDIDVRLHFRSYYRAWQNTKYCGGPVDRHFWLEKSQLIAVLGALGFNSLAFSDVAPDHPNGPAISIFARRG